jgi:streptogramin lyase/tRNA A-37 threonylcarbamoyl transferase component Bud32
MAEDTRIGTEIAGYRIESVIGHGGMSVVYLAEHLRLHRNVALKLLAPQLAENRRFRDRFLRESTIAASIDHPNIVPIYDADEFDGVLYIAMRYVDGTDLSRVIHDEGHLDPERTISIIGQVASALDAAHARDLVHRDVKPGNVLITRGSSPGQADHAYLADFGLTKRALSVSGSLTETGQLVGTVDYVAPEQIRGDPVDGRADIYSLGCVLYHCLVGEVPYPRDTEVAVLWAHVQKPAPSVYAKRRDLPRGIDDVVATAMAKKAADRFATGAALVTDLREQLGLGPSGKPRRLGGPVRRRRRRRVALLVTATVVAVAAGAFLVTREGPVYVPGIDTVARIDADRHAFDPAIPVGRTPVGLATGEGGVWVANQTDRTIQFIDPSTGETTPGIANDAGPPTGIAVGEGGVWIASGLGQALSVIDPRTNQITPVLDQPGISSVAVGAGAVWLSNGLTDEVLRFDPVTRQVVETVTLGTEEDPSEPGAIAVGGDPAFVWVASGLKPTVFRIDPASGRARAVPINHVPTGVAVEGETVWVTSLEGDTVTRLAASGEVRGVFPVREDGCNGPTGVAITSDGVWVACTQSGIVIRIDLATRSVVERLDVQGSPDALVADENGDVWAAVRML